MVRMLRRGGFRGDVHAINPGYSAIDGFPCVASLDDLRDQGVVYHGGVDHTTLHAAMRKSSVWLYPTSGDAETFCITALKMQASGVWPVTSEAGALPEVVMHGDVGGDILTNVIERLTDHGVSVKQRQAMRAAVLADYSWDKAADNLLGMIAEDT